MNQPTDKKNSFLERLSVKSEKTILKQTICKSLTKWLDADEASTESKINAMHSFVGEIEQGGSSTPSADFPKFIRDLWNTPRESVPSLNPNISDKDIQDTIIDGMNEVINSLQNTGNLSL